ncbi:hypothetical protein AO381_0742 [Moraxella catarrhalis]|nr:hypothetical protein AO381_0742 [Moraxella catarrhalis]
MSIFISIKFYQGLLHPNQLFIQSSLSWIFYEKISTDIISFYRHFWLYRHR